MRFQPSSFAIVLCVGAALGACSDSDSSDDPRAQAVSYAREDIACTATEDCCAVLDGCLARLLIVSAGDKPKVEELLSSASNDTCVGCIPPMVQVDCVSGRCVGMQLESTGGSYEDVPMEYMETHCGRLDVPAGWEEKAVPAAPSGPASFQPKTVIGC